MRMAIRCSKCGKEYDVTLFEFGQEITCSCGQRVPLKHEDVQSDSGPLERLFQELELAAEEEKLIRIKLAQDKIVSLILDNEYPEIDINIEKEKFKKLIAELFPDKVHLYDLIYEPRFRRIWQQFRETS